jgi:hypothetical protein
MILGIEIGLTIAVCAIAALYCRNAKRGSE